MTERSGPYLTVGVDVRERTEDRDKVIDLRWAALLDEARAAGADDEVIEAVDAVIADHARSGTIESLLIVAAGDQVLLERPLSGEVLHVAYGPVPMIRPALAMQPEPIPHVVAVVDRRRAEIRVPIDAEARQEVEEVEGSTNLPLRKVQPGGWSQQRFQARVDKAWLENAKEMAPAIVAAADDADAQLIIIAGDVRERSLVRDEVEGLTQRRVIVIEEGSLAPGADDEPLEERRMQVIEEERATVMNQWRERFGSAMALKEPMAVADLVPLVLAVQKGQIETLLIDPRRSSTWRVHCSSDGQVIGMGVDDVLALGGSDPVEVDAVDALIYHSIASGADLVVVEGIDLPGGVGATLRFSDTSTALAAQERR